MSFPQHIPSTSLSFLDPSLLIENLDWLYLLSMKETDGLSEKSLTRGEEVSGFDAYLEQVDFTRSAYIKLRQDYFNLIQHSSRHLTESLLNSRNEYFSRASMMLNKINKSKIERPIVMAQYHECAYEVFKQCQGVTSCSALQSNPTRWPWGLEDFHKSLCKQELLSLFYEPDYSRQSIDKNLQRLAKEMDHKQLSKILIDYALRVGTFKQMLSLCDLNIREIVKLPRLQQKSRHLHYMRSLCDQGGFTITQLQQFTKLNYHQMTMTSSQCYLYILVSSPVGGMYKVGTGEGGTIAGKIYLHQPLKKQDDVQWVFLQNKLYLKQQNGTLDIICPDTFQTLSQMTLHCPELFQHPQMQAINKNYPLITDGEKLFIIGRKLNITKVEGAPAKVIKEPAASTSRAQKKKEAEQQPVDNTIKIMDFILFEFDLNKPTGNVQNEEESDKKLLAELYESFQGYFSKAEISKALNLNKNDMQNAAQWLVEEGEKERNKTTVSVSKQTLLCQAEITTDISAKQVKSSADIGCKEGSILQPQIISNIIWTMDRRYVTAYFEFGVKIFSKDPADEKELDQSKDEFNLRDHYTTKKPSASNLTLKGTYITTVNKYLNEFYQNPNYIVSYEHNTKRFYVMHIQWNSTDLQFPALVTIGSDFIHRPLNLNLTPATNFDEEVVNFLLQQQEQRYDQDWRLNDWYVAYQIMLKNLRNLTERFSEEDLKKIQNEKSKYSYRLNKLLLSIDNSRSEVEIRKVYAFCVEGTYDELKQIWSLFKKFHKIQYLQLLQYWVQYSELSILLNVGVHDLLKEIGEYLIQNWQSELQRNIFIKGWTLFMCSNSLQLQYLKLGDNQLLQQILSTYSSIQPETESAILKLKSKNANLDGDFKSCIHKKGTQHFLIEPLPRLLIDAVQSSKLFKKVYNKGYFVDCDISQINQQFWILAKEWATQSDLTKWQFLNMVFNMAFNDDNEWEVQHKLAFNILQVFELGVTNKEVKELIIKHNFLTHFLLQLFLSPVLQCPIDCSLLSSLMQINQNIELSTTPSRTQGIDPIGYKVFETSHPYERQKVQTFEDTYFPGALALAVDFDPRCSSDQAHDFLTINSWYSPHSGPFGQQSKLKDPMGVSYRISGKLSTKRPILMLGNVIQADFSPSGQVRNEHSLNRWGFKITIRPVYGDTYHVSNVLHMVILENIQSLLGFNENRTANEESNQHLLRWNILKNGRSGFQFDKHLIKVLGQVSISSMSYDDATLLHENAGANSQLKNKYQQLKGDLITINYKAREIQKTNIDLLQLSQQQNKYLQQILDKKGEFYKVISAIVSQFTDSFQYRTAKQKSAMKAHIEEFKQIEMLVILVTLYHSGLLDEINLLNLEHHIDMLQEARNDVINYMLKEVETMIEYQQNYEGMSLQATEMMEQQKLTQINEKIENTLWDMLQKRLEGNSEMIYKICTQQNLTIIENNPNLSLRQIFNNILAKIRESKLDLVNPYQHIVQVIKKRILILFNISNVQLVGQQQMIQIKSQQSIDSGSIKQLKPLGIERSLSHQIDDKNIDSQKLLKFRQWLDSYQKWKVLHNVNLNQISAESLDIPPVKSVILFLQQNVNESLIQVMDLHNRRCIRRIASLKFLNEFQGQSGGILCQDVMNYKIEFASSNIKEILLQEVVKRLNYLMQSIKNDYATYLNQAITQQIDGTLLEQLKVICMTLCEINQLFQVDNNILWKSREHDYNPHFNPIFKQFLNNIIITGLLSLAFVNLDQQYQSVALLSQNILNNVKETLYIITDNLMTDDILQQLIQILSQELGISLQGDEINCRLLTKLYDLIGVKRVNFLLTNILDCLMIHQNQEVPPSLVKLIFYILHHSNTPSTMRLAIRISKYFSGMNLNQIKYTPKYLWMYYENCNQQQIKVLQENKEQSFSEVLIERVGHMVCQDEVTDNQNINTLLQNELVNVQKKMITSSNTNSDQNNNQQYRVILHLCQEEEISILLKILYWWEEQFPSLKLKLPQTYQEYLEMKEKEKKREEQKTQQQEVIAQQTEFQSQRQQQQQQYKLLERVLMTQPEIQQKDYLLGWGFNYSNLYSDMKSGPSDNKKHSSGRVKKQIKKYWRPLNFQELERLYEELYKQNEDIKSFPDEQAFLRQRNFITRIHSHIKEIKNYGSLLTVYGCIPFSEIFTIQKAQVLIELIQSALNGTLPNIPMNDLSEEFKNKADPNKYILLGAIKEVAPPKGKSQPQKAPAQIQPQPTSGKSQMTVSVCDVYTFQSFEFRMDYITLLPYGNTSVNFYNEINRSSSFTQQIVNGQIVGQLIYELSQLLCHQQIDIKRENKYYKLGYTTILSQQLIQIAPGIPVQIKKHKSYDKQYVVSGGDYCGQKELRLLSNNDDKLNLQVVNLDEIELIQQDIPQLITQEQVLDLIDKESDKFILRNLFIIASKLEWKGYNVERIVNKILNLATLYQGDNKFNQAWERLIDSKLSPNYFFPIEIPKTIKFLQQPQQVEQEDCKIEPFVENVDNTIIVGSTYMQSLPEACIVSNELKLVQYWEKNILPKIYDYVKGSLKPYEIEDFFEQIRQQLRKGEQNKALEIAYIVCDQRMPNGVIIPESNHDWSTLTIEEVQAGQYVLCRLIDKTSEWLYSKEYLHYKKQGQTFICGQIIGVDQRSSSIFITHMDINNSQLYATWFPVSALKQVQLYIPPNANAYQQETILKEYNRELDLELSKQARQLYILLSQTINVDPIIYLQLAMQFEGSCINGWLTEQLIDENTKINQKLNQFLQQPELIFGWLSKSFEQINQFVNKNKLFLDLFKSHKKPLELNSDLDIAGLAIVFNNDATLCTCSGINFYKDRLGINDFYTISSGKETRGRLSPIILNQKNVYCEYYFNGEALPIYQQKQCVSRLPCVVYKIPTLWNTVCYVIDQMSTIFIKNKDIPNIKSINNLLEKVYEQQPHILNQSIIKLLIRNIRKLQSISNDTLTDDLLTHLVNDAVKIYNIQKVEPNVLYSSYLQDLTELLAVAIPDKTKIQIPDWLNAYRHFIQIADFIKCGKPLYNEQIDQINEMLQSNQWDQLIYMQGLPCDIQDVLQEQLVRILNPAVDIFRKQNQAIILIDGFQQLNLENVEIQLPPEPVQEAVKLWQCEMCTFAHNFWDSSQCAICENPAPANKVPYKEKEDQSQQLEQQSVQVNVDEEDEKADKREKQFFEDLIERIQDKIKKYYTEKQIEKEQKMKQINQAIEAQQNLLKQLNRQQEKKQKQQVYKSKLQQPKQPQLQLQQQKIKECQQKLQQLTSELQELQNAKLENTFQIYSGKQILEKAASFLQVFLQHRLEYFRAQINPKFLEEMGSMDAIESWKYLETQGYDLHYQLVQNPNKIQILPIQQMKHLLKLIEFDICKETKAVRTYNPKRIRNLIDEQAINYQDFINCLTKYQDLVNAPIYVIRQSWAIIKLFNRYLETCGQFINMDVPIGTSQEFQQRTIFLSMGNYMQVLRQFCMTPTKVDIVQRVLNKTSISRDSPPKINVERIRLANRNGKTNQQDFLFTMAYEQMKNIPPTLLRPIKPQGTDPFLAFEVNFKGEDVQGESGPYRQFFADISKELQSSQLLLYPSTNNQAKLGNHKDKFVLNPSARSNFYLHLYEFLGILMAIAIRTATHFSLDLPSIFWKQIVGEKITFEDIEQIDATMCNLINFMQECPESTFEENIFENWVTLRTDKSVQELKENGSKIPVKYEERLEYINKLIEVKCTESELQCESLIKGLIKIIPSPLLNWVSAEDLELWVCGRPIVDVDLLKRHTRYSGDLNENSDRIKFFWEALYELSEQEKLRFIKFCWGQERLPANDEEFDRNQIRFMIKPSTVNTKQPNKALPKADTCFFNLELPNYSSKDILKKQLLTAINLDCDSMNADPRVNLDPNARHRRNRDEDEDDSLFEEGEW
ncbi:unnamed protein product [Paramecium octaurelia]|uniref:HECT domain-containing protein n=1 Tax=Paramecium octaurelia TaxID=43137 RepID=A0A8S1UFM8_PAROT|nr:unnamed protein product [Paramecium octaurelia]